MSILTDGDQAVRETRHVGEQIRDIRRHLHKHPELGFQEFQTAALIEEYLRKSGIPVHRAGDTGVIGVLTGNKQGPIIALRADMDALPLPDEKTVDYASTVDGVMHGCGHDAHVAMLLGAAGLLAGHRELIAGEIRFVFQPAEECPPGGALGIIEDGWLDGVDRACAIHVWNGIETGQAWIASGPITAASDRFTISIQGKGGHGALPQQCVDSVVIGSLLVSELQTIVSRKVDPIDPAVVTVGMFKAGSNFNVIADNAELGGTVRTFDDKVRGEVKKAMESLISGICSAHGATGSLDYLNGYPPTVCDEQVTKLVQDSCRSVLGPECLVESRPIMGGEDFAYFADKVPSAIVFLGSGGSNPGVAPPHHHPLFDIDEAVLELGVASWLRIAGDMLNR